MTNRFTLGIQYLNNLINQTKKGSNCYKLLVRAKHRYILDFK